MRTQLISVKNSNAALSTGLEEALTKGEKFKQRIIQMETQLETFRVMRDERELKYESTIGQQTKLIDFLQAKTEVKKKSTLSDKLFGSSRKENPPAAIPVGYRDLESMLEKKKTQVRSLMEQLEKCKVELAASRSENGTASGTKENGSTANSKHGDVLAELPKNHLTTPMAYRALSRITQSPGAPVFLFSLLL